MIIFLCLAIAASVALNLLLGYYARQFYWTLADLRLDPLGIHYYSSEKQAPAPEPHRQRVVFYGDSRAEAWPAPDGIDGFHFFNRGIGGQTSAQVLGRFDAHIRPLQPDVVIIQVGINDLQAIAMFPDREGEIVARCKENLIRLVERSLEINAIVLLTTIFPHGPISWDRTIFWSDAVDQATDEVNALILSLDSDRVHVLDTAPLLQDQAGLLQENYRLDFLHLNEVGYAALNAALAEQLRNIGR